jgi:hypothetical protein
MVLIKMLRWNALIVAKDRQRMQLIRLCDTHLVLDQEKAAPVGVRLRRPMAVWPGMCDASRGV